MDEAADDPVPDQIVRLTIYLSGSIFLSLQIFLVQQQKIKEANNHV